MAWFGGKRRQEDERPMIVDAGGASSTGPRPDNQDRWAATPAWAVVSDGAGGHAGGAIAAELTVAAVVAALTAGDGPAGREVLAAAIGRANAEVCTRRRADAGVAGMAATLTVAVALEIEPERSRWLVANVGDSPAWRLTAAGPFRVTRDHNLAAELVRAGVLDAEEARTHPGRHRITRAMGIDEDALADTAEVDLGPGDALVLASDGVEVLDEAMLGALGRSAASAADAARRIVDAALIGGATDNVTVVVLRHLPSADAASRPS